MLLCCPLCDVILGTSSRLYFVTRDCTSVLSLVPMYSFRWRHASEYAVERSHSLSRSTLIINDFNISLLCDPSSSRFLRNTCSILTTTNSTGSQRRDARTATPVWLLSLPRRTKYLPNLRHTRPSFTMLYGPRFSPRSASQHLVYSSAG
jgi:hypothetical protein